MANTLRGPIILCCPENMEIGCLCLCCCCRCCRCCRCCCWWWCSFQLSKDQVEKKCYSKIASVWQKHIDILGMQKSSGIVLGIGGGSVVEAWSANLTDTGLNSAGWRALSFFSINFCPAWLRWLGTDRNRGWKRLYYPFFHL